MTPGARLDAMGTHYVIYSPPVPVFRIDAGPLLDERPHLPRAADGKFATAFELVIFAITDWSEEQRFIGPFQEIFER